MRNPFENFKKGEWVLWIISVIATAAANVFSENASFVTCLSTFVGVTALIFVARGDVWGQILTVLFSILYAIVSFEQRYFGEMITYLGMTMPIAVMSVVSWIKNPYKKGTAEVRIHRLTFKQKILMIILSLLVTTVFYLILKALETPALFVSTVSITTSFLASYLMLYRNSYYAVAYAANDFVLIILWVMASLENIGYIPIVICFLMFLINDIYGFVSWKRRERRQRKN